MVTELDILCAAHHLSGTAIDGDRIGRENVDSASGPASPILTEYGRRVGSLGPGLTSESADAASGCPARRFVGRAQVFLAPTGVPV